ADTSWVDTSVVWNDTYYYRVTAFDTSTPFENEAFFSDSQPEATPWTGPNWYVNDTWTASDSYTYAGGSDTSYGIGSPSRPLRTITYALTKVGVGDTILADAGRYAESVTISVDSIWLEGADSGASGTVIEDGDSDGTPTTRAIYATGRVGLVVKNLRAQNSFRGIEFDNVDYGRIENVTVRLNGDLGIYLITNADGNTVLNNLVTQNTSSGIFGQSTSVSNTFTGNTVTNNGADGVRFFSSSSTNTLTDNYVADNALIGIQLNNSDNNLITGNTVMGNGSDGIRLTDFVTNGSDNNRLYRNVIRNNDTYGIWVNVSKSNIFMQNTIDSNGLYGVNLAGAATSDSFYKNIILGSEVFPDSAVRNTAANVVWFLRDWFGTADSIALGNKITGSGASSVITDPWRLGTVDTSAGADTTAPEAPDTVAVVDADTSVILEWSAVTALEEANGGAVALSGYRVYRSQVLDTSSWIKVAQVGSGTIRYQDTDVTPGSVYYYRVTAFDTAAPFENESFFSDSQPSDSAVFTSRKIWYVNDTSTASDSFTYAGGSDTSGGEGTAAKPFKTFLRVMQFVTAGDTVYADRGVYQDTVLVDSDNDSAVVSIEVDNVWIEGVDSTATIIDPAGANSLAGLNGIYADSQVGLVIRNLAVTGAYWGISFVNVDSSVVSGDSFSSTGRHGLYVESGDNNTYTGNQFYDNANTGFFLKWGTGNLVRGNEMKSNVVHGINLWLTNSNSVRGNHSFSNGQYGMFLSSDSEIAVIGNRMAGNTRAGFLVQNSETNTLDQNEITGNDTGIWFDLTSYGNAASKNNISGNTVNNIYNASGLKQTLTRNWFGSADSVAIAAKISDALSDRDPWRLGAVDTSAGADTIAPDAPDTVAVIGSPSDTSVILEWSAVTANEETAAGGLALSGYRVYRSAVKDTSSWIKMAQVGSGVIRWQDTDVALGTAYYYRVTAFDTAAPYANESFFSDSQPVDSAQLAATVNFYVNDTYTAADSFTYAGGSDTSYGNGSASKPFRTIPRAMRFATAGDTIWIDAGTYDSFVTVNGTETAGVNIDKDSVTLIGKDSNATVINPSGASTINGLYGIFADSQTGLVIRNLGVTGAYEGMHLYNVDRSTIGGDSVCSNGDVGIYLQYGSETNTVTGNTASSDSYGIVLYWNSNNNTVTGNTADTNLKSGILLDSSSNNMMSGNSVVSNTEDGFLIYSSSNSNFLTGNRAVSNLRDGIQLWASSNNRVTQNDLLLNARYQISIASTSSSDTIQKNNIIPASANPDSGVLNTSAAAGNIYTFTRNYWNSTDTGRIKQMIYQRWNSDSILWQPFRLGEVDTASGADTVAPKAPDSVTIDAATGGDTSIVVTWGNSTTSEEGTEASGVALSGYRLYRSQVKDTSSWIKIVDLGNVQVFQDTDVAANTTYYYRVTAFDTKTPFENESFFSDSQPNDSAVVGAGPNAWYVNDTSTSGDSFTTAVGSAGNSGLTRGAPKRLLSEVVGSLTEGDTVYVDSGWFNDAATIGTDSVWIIGVDSLHTVIINTASIISASGRVGLALRDFAVRGVTAGSGAGILFTNVDYSTIERVRSDSHGTGSSYGFNLISGSDSNVLKSVTASGGAAGVRLSASYGCTVAGGFITGQTGVAMAGVYLIDGAANAVTNVTVRSSAAGVRIEGADNNRIENSEMTSNTGEGILLVASGTAANSNTISGCTSTLNSYGFRINNTTAVGNVFSNNYSETNTTAGLAVNSTNGRITGNTVRGEALGVYLLNGATYTSVVNNTLTSCTEGIQVSLTGAAAGSILSDTLALNTIRGSKNNGIIIYDNSDDVRVIGNLISGSGLRGIEVINPGGPATDDPGDGSPNIYEFNNLIENVQSADFTTAVAANNQYFDLLDDTGASGDPGIGTGYRATSNDTAILRAAIDVDGDGVSDSGSVVYWIGAYRSANPKTARSNAAPAATALRVDGFVADGLSIDNRQPKITWTFSDGDGDTQTDFWVQISTSSTFATISDSKQVHDTKSEYTPPANLAFGTYYARVRVNDGVGDSSAEYWSGAFSSGPDSFVIVDTTIANAWYVNDTSLTGDGLTTTTGADTWPGLDAAHPKRHIPSAMSRVTAGDTVNVDAGLYDSFVTVNSSETAGVNITVDSVALIGKDSGATVIDPPGANTLASLYGIWADTQVGLLIKNLGVTGAYDGIHFYNVDNSRIESDSVSSCGEYGIYLHVNSDTNTIKDVISNNHSSFGISLNASSNNTLTGNTANSSLTGIDLSTNSNGNRIEGNTAKSNAASGIGLTLASNNIVRNNLATANQTNGISLSSTSINNTFSQNELRGNVQYQVNISGASSSDTFEKNTIVPSATNPDSGVYNGSTTATNKFTFTRNWWNSTDTGRIKQMIYQASNGDSVIWQPFRLGQVDTAAGADTTAPKAPDTVAALDADTSVVLEWTAVTANEETAAGGVALSGYRVYRSTIKDTSSWIKIAALGNVIRYEDTTAVKGTTYYYRVTAFDTATFTNESFFSDSQPEATPWTGPDWYVNDTWTASDSYTYAGGSDTSYGIGSPARPFRSAAKAMQKVLAGDTVWIDSGVYADTYVRATAANDTAALEIDTDNLTVIGVDSVSTVIDVPGPANVTAHYSIYADTQIGLSIRNLRVTGANRGIYFVNVDTSTITNVQADSNGQVGIFLSLGSEGNTISQCLSVGNVLSGYYFSSVNNNTVTGNTAKANRSNGYYLLNSWNNTLTYNLSDNDSSTGFTLDTSDTNTLRFNEAVNDTGSGYYLVSANNNLVADNTARASTTYGIYLDAANTNRILRNAAKNNFINGIRLENSNFNEVIGNEATGNSGNAVYILGTSDGDTFQKNVFDTGVYNSTTRRFDFTRNWWTTTDEVAILAKLSGPGRDSVVFSPYRLAVVDTAAGADTTAPGLPASVALDTSVIGQITVTWVIPTVNEETNGGAVAYNGARVYRLRNTADTTHWANTLVWTASAAATSWMDTTITAGDTYFYRLTSRDTHTFVNESFFTDTKWSTTPTAYAGPNWYVNDTYTAADSYTYAGGADTSYADGSASKPYRSLAKVMQKVKSGDTIWLDAGLYGSDTWEMISATETAAVNLDTDNLTLIGKDSGATVIDPAGAKTQAGLYGVYADTQVGLTIKNLGVTGAYDGVKLVNVEQSAIQGDSASSNGEIGIYLLDGSDSNTISANTVGWNSNIGIYVYSRCNNNAVSGNTADANTTTGIQISTLSYSNTLSNNTARSNTYGIRLSSNTDYTSVIGNLIRSNSWYGIYVSVSSNNLIVQNTIDSNARYQIYIESTSSSDTVQKNNIATSGTNPDSGVYNASTEAANKFTFTRNWWNSTDTARIKQMIYQESNGDSVIWQPFRLGAVDTSAGADTVAPKAPDTVAVLDADTSVVLEWTAVTANEEAASGGVALSGYRVYRSQVKDTSSWVKIGQTGSGAIRFEDTGVTQFATYYYRVTAFDTATPFENEAFFSDSQPSAFVVDTSGPNVWYVNDTSTAGDSYTTAHGYDTQNGLTRSTPFRTLVVAARYLTGGDTILADAGVYDSFVTVNSAETAGVNLAVDSVALIGVDSAATIIDPPGANSLVNLYGVYADTQVGLTIKNIGVTGAYDGIHFYNVDNSTVESDSASSCGNAGIHLRVNSDANTIKDNEAMSNLARGIYLDASSNNTVTNNRAGSNSTHGIRLYSSSTNTVTNNTVSSNSDNGIYLDSSLNCTVENNTASSNSNNGIYLYSSSNNRVMNNTAVSNSYGIALDASSNNQVLQNDARNNTQYQIYIDGASNSDTVQKNNIAPSGTNPDSGIYNGSTAAGNTFAFTRNWWNSTDTGRIKQMIYQASNGDSVIWQPFRLGQVDTAAGADTTAPKAPDSVAVIGTPSDTSVILEWSAATALEEANGGAVALSGYRVYRSTVKDTSSWIKVAQVGSAQIRYQDTDVVLGTAYYYRVTAFDTAAFENESFFSDSQPFDSAVFTSRVNWYVNDTSTAGDSYTSAGGSDTPGGEGTATKPFKTLPRVMQFVTAGDTVFIDSGVYDSYMIVSATETAGISIGVDSVSLVGVDSAGTLIDPQGSGAGVYGIYADTQTGLIVRNLRVRDAYLGVAWVNVDLGRIASCDVGSAGAAGLYMANSDTNTVAGVVSNSNGNYGLNMQTSSGNTVSGFSAVGNSTTGVYTVESSGNIYTSITAGSTTGDGVQWSGGSNNKIDNSSCTSNTGDGIELQGHTGGVISNCDFNGNGLTGIFLLNSSSNTIRDNLIRSNTLAGIDLGGGSGSSNNAVYQNDIRGNDTGVWIEPLSTGNIISKNNIQSNVVNNIYNQLGAGNTTTRNWFGSADSVAIKAKISDTANAFVPWRLGTVDTSAGADTVAPKSPDTVAAIDTSNGQIKLEWSAVTANEDGAAGAIGLGGYRIYRSKIKDTSSWIQVGQVGSGAIQFTDTTVTANTGYFYRVTAFDTASPFANESFFSDSQPIDSGFAYAGPNWYVNDTYTAADSYTYAGGSDTGGDGSASKPYRSLPQVMQKVKAGDTIWLDAGQYGSDTWEMVSATETAAVNLDTDNLALIGKDSGATVIDPAGAKTQAGLFGIYADTQTGLLVKNIGVTGAYEGIKWLNVDASTISGDSVSSNGDVGIYLLNGSDTNTLSGNAAMSNSQNGIYLLSSSNNTVSNNTASSNVNSGIYLQSNSSNTISNNTASSNGDGYIVWLSSSNTLTNNASQNNSGNGYWLTSNSNSNTLTNNTSRNNLSSGFSVNNSSNNKLIQNTSDSNALYAFYISGTSSSDTFAKNVFVPSPYAAYRDSGVWNQSSVITNKFTFTRNWWGMADSVTIDKLIWGPGADSIIYSPWRLGIVDTAAGADTVAPKAPDTAVVLDADTSVILEWTAVTSSEEGNEASGVALSGYRVYRSTVKDTSSWIQIGQTGSGAIRFEDTWVTQFSTYYYRVTAFDTATPFENQSFFSDSQPSAFVVDTSGPNVWYVNDTSTAGDSYTTAHGYDTQNGLTRSTPFRTLVVAARYLTPGDTILADAGLYDSFVTVNSTETAGVNINADSVSLIGVDSAATIIDPPGANSLANLYGVYADTQMGLTIKNLGVTGANEGIYFYNVDNSRIESDSVSSCGDIGVYLRVNSDTNTVTGNVVNSNVLFGIYLSASSGNTVTANTANSNPEGIYLTAASNGNTFSNNTLQSNGTDGMFLDGSSNNTISGNTVNSNNYGIYLITNSNGNTLTGNAVTSSTIHGIALDASSNNTVTNNLVNSNAQYGIRLLSADNSRVFQNDVRNNTLYQIYIDGTSSSDTVQKNNIVTSGTNPDSGVFNGATTATNKFTLTRNYWNSTDTSRIKQMIYQASNGDSIIWQAFRLGEVDTSAGADTIAPKAPDSVTISAATGGDTSVVLTWLGTTAAEEGTEASGVALSGYRVYRSLVKDTSSWIRVAALGNVQVFQDTDVTANTTYYYRLTAFDTKTPFENESFFSDSQPSDSAVPYAGPNWYVNDTYTAADSYTYAGGSDTSGADGSASKPYRSLAKVMQKVKAGDTIWLDAGQYGSDTWEMISSTETAAVNLDTDNLALIGVDSGATVIDPAGANTLVDLYGIYADTQTGLVIKNLGVTGVYDGIHFYNVDNSRVEGDSTSSCGNVGIYLRVNSDTNTITNNTVRSNTNYGIYLVSSSGNTLTGNTASSNLQGIYLDASSNNTTLTGNTASSNTNYGIHLYSNSNNTLTSNMAGSNSLYGILLNSSSNNTVTSNTASSNLFYGIYLSFSSNNTVVQNDVRNNTRYQVYIDQVASSDTVQKNNIVPSATNPDSGVYNGSTEATNKFTFTRNWWNSTDTGRIKKMIYQASNGDSVIWQPFRLGQVDTAAGADTTAPKAPDTVAIADASSDTSIILEWTAVTALEESNGGAVALTGYRVYRSAVADTSSWIKIGQVGASTIRFQDTTAATSTLYYYRVTVFDTATPFENESFFSDSQPSDSIIFYAGPNWYVNDTYTAADSYTYAGGSDTSYGDGSASKPYRSLAKVMPKVKSGDTIWLDAGTFGSDTWEMISATETAAVNLDTDNLALIGVDSGATVIDPAGAKTLTGLYGIYADTQTGLLVKNIGVMGAYEGIKWVNVDVSTLSGDSVSSNGNYGIYLLSGSDTNTLTDNTSRNNSDAGFRLLNSGNDTLTNNTSQYNSMDGFFLDNSNNNTLTNNSSQNNTWYGFRLATAGNNTLTNNTSQNNSNIGFGLVSSSDNNTLTNNTSQNNSADGFQLSSSGNNRLTNNTSQNNSNVGFNLVTTSNTNTLTNNTSRNNSDAGFYLSVSSNNTLTQNTSDSNAKYAFHISGAGSSD
ncbi:right-handed parallel beta-helix repeat-containing protein, partial [bacterium]|nr:right-handed parallel beta-helix repeat-containing protein [bacterium]